MMFNNNSKKARAPAAQIAQPLMEIRKREISDRLKIVERLIKIGNLDEARSKLDIVRTMDPKNGYILALEERIDELRKTKVNLPPSSHPQVHDDPPTRYETDRKDEKEFLEGLTEEVHRFEERLEAEYRDKFTEEIGKVEQRITQMLKEKLESREAERSALIGNLEREKDKLFRDWKKETRKLFDAEFKKADDLYRKLLVEKLGGIEEKVRAEARSEYENAVDQLREALTAEKVRLLEEERNAIREELRNEAKNEIKALFMEELEKERAALAALREEREEEERLNLQANAEEDTGTDTDQIVGETEASSTEPQPKAEELYQRSIRDIREAVEKLDKGVKQGNPVNEQAIDNKPPDIEKELTSKLVIKSSEQRERERDLMEKLRALEFKDILNGVDWKDRPHKKKG